MLLVTIQANLPEIVVSGYTLRFLKNNFKELKEQEGKEAGKYVCMKHGHNSYLKDSIINKSDELPTSSWIYLPQCYNPFLG